MTRPNASALFYQTDHIRPVLDRAEGIYMWAENGQRFIDGSSGAMLCNIGHSNPAVLAAMRAQMDKSTFGYRLHFVTEASEALAAALVEKAWPGQGRVFFVSGGSEAVESALKLARQYAWARGEKGRHKIISRWPSYHGCTLGALAVTGYDPLTEPFAALMVPSVKVPAPTAWADHRDPLDPATGAHYAAALEAAILAEGPESVLAFLVEPIGGASTGALVPPSGYLEAVRALCDRYGILLIYDEVMTGVARTGRFFGGQHWPVAPDILALAKGLGAGYVPLGAIIARTDLVETVLAGGGFAHGFTSAGNPFACATGLAVLGEVERLGLVAAAEAQGATLAAGLRALAARYPFIGDVRGKGLLLAMELCESQESRRPLPASLKAYDLLTEAAYQRGLIIYPRRTRGGYVGDHVLIAPPLIITPAQIDELLMLLDAALADVAPTLLKACTP
jgi:adenosylmethionine-8-amino-7-oxononanoate aminotransferase